MLLKMSWLGDSPAGSATGNIQPVVNGPTHPDGQMVKARYVQGSILPLARTCFHNFGWGNFMKFPHSKRIWDGTWWNPNMAILNGRCIKLICSEFQAIFPSTGTTCERFSIGCFANSFDTSRNRADQNNWDGFFIISWQVEVATKTTSSCLG